MAQLVMTQEEIASWNETRARIWKRALDFLPEENGRKVVNVEIEHEDGFVFIYWEYLNGGLLLNGPTIARQCRDFFTNW